MTASQDKPHNFLYDDSGLLDEVAPMNKGKLRVVMNRPTSTDAIHRKMTYLQNAFELGTKYVRMYVRGWWLTTDGEPVNFNTTAEDGSRIFDAEITRIAPSLRLEENLEVTYDGERFHVEPIVNAENMVVFVLDWEAHQAHRLELKERHERAKATTSASAGAGTAGSTV